MTATREHLAGLELALDEMRDMLDGSCEARLTRLIAEAQSAPEPVQGEAWIDAVTRNPEVGRGRDIEVLVAVRRKHNGKIYVFTTRYLNAYPVIYQDQVIQDDDNDQPEITGWFYLSDDEETWHRTLSEGDELLAWMYKPAYPLYTAAARPDWREHSRHIAKGEKCPETIETLQAAWDRDQELLDDQRKEIASVKQKLNQARQSKAKPDAELVALLVECQRLLSAEPHGILSGMADQGKRAEWYSAMTPVRDRIDAKLAALQP